MVITYTSNIRLPIKVNFYMCSYYIPYNKTNKTTDVPLLVFVYQCVWRKWTLVKPDDLPPESY